MTGDAIGAEVVIADRNDSRFHATVGRLQPGLAVRRCLNLVELEAAISRGRAEVVVIGTLGGGTVEALTAAHQVREQRPSARVILIAESSSEPLVLSALRAGVAEFLKAPLTGIDVADAIARFLPPDAGDDWCPDLVGASTAMLDIKTMIRRIAGMNSTVLITGETGTGKEVAARLIHRLSARSEKPLICVNCAAIPDALLESELFGYEKGAFTGAAARSPGQLRLADGGTLFLDEIGDMSASAQAKILRAIEQHEVQPLGSSKTLSVNIRTIAATHHDLEQLVDEGRFRSDLFFRLHVAALRLPTLRERPEDIPALARHFLRQINREHGRAIEDFTPPAMRRLTAYHWPGNVRQLRNTVEGAVLMCDARRISEQNLHTPLSVVAGKPLKLQMSRRTESNLPARSEPARLMQALDETNWNVSKAAEILSWSRMTVYRKVAKYELEREPGSNRSDPSRAPNEMMNRYSDGHRRSRTATNVG